MIIQYRDNKRFRRAHEHGWHDNLILVVSWLPTVLTKVMVLTSSWRPFKIHGKDSGIAQQVPVRHADFRSRNYDDPHSIARAINHRWIYDPNRPQLKVCVYHDVGYGHHFHIQVHNNTILRGGSNGD